MATSKRKSKNKSIEITNDGVLDIQNMDLERADEFIVSAIKKKLKDTYKEDDQEDLLFDEQESSNISNNKPEQKVKSLTNIIHKQHVKSLKAVSLKQKLNVNNNPIDYNQKLLGKCSKYKSKTELCSTKPQLEDDDKKHSCKLEQRFNKYIKEQLHETSNSSHHNHLENNPKNEAYTIKHTQNERTIRNPDFLKKILNKYEPLEPNSSERLATIITERRVSIDGASEIEEPEPTIQRRSIRVNGMGLNLRQKMLQRLHAAQSRYEKTSSLRQKR